MLLFRSLSLGFLGACLLLLASRPVYELRVEAGPPAEAALAAVPAATIVDVAAGIPTSQLGALLRLAPGERVVAVDDRLVANDLDAGAALAASDAHSGGYIDLTVRGRAGSRRMLVLLH